MKELFTNIDSLKTTNTPRNSDNFLNTKNEKKDISDLLFNPEESVFNKTIAKSEAPKKLNLIDKIRQQKSIIPPQSKNSNISGNKDNRIQNPSQNIQSIDIIRNGNKKRNDNNDIFTKEEQDFLDKINKADLFSESLKEIEKNKELYQRILLKEKKHNDMIRAKREREATDQRYKNQEDERKERIKSYFKTPIEQKQKIESKQLLGRKTKKTTINQKFNEIFNKNKEVKNESLQFTSSPSRNSKQFISLTGVRTNSSINKSGRDGTSKRVSESLKKELMKHRPNNREALNNKADISNNYRKRNDNECYLTEDALALKEKMEQLQSLNNTEEVNKEDPTQINFRKYFQKTKKQQMATVPSKKKVILGDKTRKDEAIFAKYDPSNPDARLTSKICYAEDYLLEPKKGKAIIKNAAINPINPLKIRRVMEGNQNSYNRNINGNSKNNGISKPIVSNKNSNIANLNTNKTTPINIPNNSLHVNSSNLNNMMSSRNNITSQIPKSSVNINLNNIPSSTSNNNLKPKNKFIDQIKIAQKKPLPSASTFKKPKLDYDSYEDDDFVVKDEDDYKIPMRKPLYYNKYDDESDIEEANFDQIEKEEAITARIGEEEDYREFLKEQKLKKKKAY